MASTQKFSNRASSLLAVTIAPGDLSITVADGSAFPSPGASEFFLATLENAAGATEIVKIQSRAGAILTVAAAGRGQEGTTAAAWTQNITRVELRMTKGTMERFLQDDGDSMTGDLDMNGNDVIDAVLSGSGTKMIAGEIVGVPVRGLTGITTNELVVPTDGTSRATVGALPIATRTDISNALPVGSIIMWGLAIGSRPAGWEVCDGVYAGTPDLRDKFIIGVSGTRALNSTTGTPVANTAAAGSHTHTVGGTAITSAQMPAHNHEVYAANNYNDVRPLSHANSGVVGNGAGTQAYLDVTGSGNKAIRDTGGGATHTHTATTEPTHVHAQTYAPPPSYALYYIMRMV